MDPPIVNGALIFRLPSNTELGLSDAQVAYRTIPFPVWAHCERHQIIYFPSEAPPSGCPRCSGLSRVELTSKARKEAVRFVLACHHGHMDEVPWPALVKHMPDTCEGTAFLWEKAGGGLKNVELKCIDCGGTGKFGHAYGRDWPCTGRRPENLGAPRVRCTEFAEITQRLATNLRLSDNVSALTIPPTDGPLHRMLLSSGLFRATVASPVSTKAELVAVAQRLLSRRLVDPNVFDEVRRRSESELLRALAELDEVQQHGAGTTLSEVKARELRELQKASRYGHLGTAGDASYFEVDHRDVKHQTGPNGLQFRITPVRRLRVVTVQTGYRRLTTDPNKSRSVDVSILADDGRLGIPGVEVFGEGLFVDLAEWDGPFPNPGRVQQSWTTDPQRAPDLVWPEYVWWHTFSHRLITALSVDSGYSASSIRERVYARPTTNPQTASGGILLYTSQPGSDGSLGGLIVQASRFEQILDGALYSLDECSNDPLCIDSVFVPGKANGAACYACQLVSETACEARNRGLDRNLLMETRP